MKKELFAVGLLLLIIACSVLNLMKITAITDEMSVLADQAEKLAAEESWDAAVSRVEQAISVWEENDSYTHIIMHHTEIDSVTGDLYGLLAAVTSRDGGGTYAAAELVKTHLRSISSIETPKPGSIM